MMGGKREVREAARGAVYALLDLNIDNWPDCELGTGYEDLDGDELDVFLDEVRRIMAHRVWP